MLSRPLALVTAVLTGLLTGGMVLIEVVLVPFWRSAAPAEFRGWFTAHSGRIRALLVPLGAAAGLAGAASAAAQVAERRRSGPAIVAAAATAGVITVTVTVNEPANHRFVDGALTDGETAELLTTWARWHHLRVVLGIAATATAVAALPGPDRGAPRRRSRSRRAVSRRARPAAVRW